MRIKRNKHSFMNSSSPRLWQLVFVILCLAPVQVLSAQDKASSDINATASAPAEKNASNKTHEKKQQAPPQPPAKAANSTSRFKPSEEILEDYSVPFPVDI
jgi:hypothetical protein